MHSLKCEYNTAPHIGSKADLQNHSQPCININSSYYGDDVKFEIIGTLVRETLLKGQEIKRYISNSAYEFSRSACDLETANNRKDPEKSFKDQANETFYEDKSVPEKMFFDNETYIKSSTPVDMSMPNDTYTINSNTQTPPQQYCLRWNNFHTNLTRTFSELFVTQSFVDVTLTCSKSKSLKAHKLVLSASSPYFYELFLKNNCEHVLIIINDVEFNELTKIIEFMYKGEINIVQEEIEPLLKVAQLLKVRGLADLGHDDRCFDSRQKNIENLKEFNTKKFLGAISQSDEITCRWLKSNDLLEHLKIKDSVAISDNESDSDQTEELIRKKKFLIENQLDGNSLGKRRSDYSEISIESNIPIKQRKRNYDLNFDKMNVIEMPDKFVETNSEKMCGKLGIDSDLFVNEKFLNCVNPPPTIRALLNSSPSAIMDGSIATLSESAKFEAEKIVGASIGNDSIVEKLDDLEIKPGIAEMIREEERAKLLESSQAWLGASTSSIADSYQYQLQSLWQKCWNTNQQSLLHNLRFRERGPLKSWRPETMAEAIFSVLKQGLSLSQAARKYDIPYPTFVLYANRVHNMLGPSADGGNDLRPKGRGRPQRILLGVWPDEHIRGVIRTVVFRDNTHSTDRQLLNNERFQGNDKIALVDEESSVLQVRDEADLLCLNNQNLSNSTKTELFPNDNSSYHKDVSEYKDQLHKYCTLNKIMLTPQASTLDPTLWVTIAQRQRYMSEAEVHHSSLLVRSGMCLAESPTTGDVYVAPSETRDSPSPAAFDLSGTYSLPVPYNYGNKFPPTVAELGPGSSFVQKERHPADLPETVRCQTNVSLPNIAETSEIKDTNSLKLSP